MLINSIQNVAHGGSTGGDGVWSRAPRVCRPGVVSATEGVAGSIYHRGVKEWGSPGECAHEGGHWQRECSKCGQETGLVSAWKRLQPT